MTMTREMMTTKKHCSETQSIKTVRHGEFSPCRTAFIDTHTPGSNLKENFTIIGGGVSENPDQHVHIVDTPGFNIGAAGQPPKCRNSLHSHRTAEVFIALKGRWRFFWGRYGTTGEVTLEQGDIINIPTGIFRGFENIGQEYGMLLAILGGDDAGGGVIWAPQVIEEARDHGLILADTGKLYDSKKGESLPDGIKTMPPLTEEELKQFVEPTPEQVVPNYVARKWDMIALSNGTPADVISSGGMLVDKPGFEVSFLSHNTEGETYSTDHSEVLMATEGHWKIRWEDSEQILAPGDVSLLPRGGKRKIEAAVSGEAGLFRVTGTDDPAGPTWKFPPET